MEEKQVSGAESPAVGWFSLIRLRNSGGAAERLARTCQEGYAMHQLIWRLFPGEKERRFLYRTMDRGEDPACYVVSALEPQDTEEIWHVQSRPYHPRLQVGDRMTFALRANPVVARKTPGSRSVRHDVVMDAKKRAAQSNGVGDFVDLSGKEWLESRAVQNGFRVDSVAVEGYRQHRLRGRNGEIRFSTLDFEGGLTVTDQDLFRRSLWMGIGPAKGFGCGLILIKRR
ncbi:MAG: type I-E CRISPR-associated protein Cas6/Cse3/CasE [Magnetococcales bacterium]|nr:type I-E CRISPR-associated protein Cas6/Cse3/CasE [Magnetococcales bacterium]